MTTTTDDAPMAVPERLGRAIAEVLIAGDLSKLSPAQKVSYYLKVTDSLGLNPYTKPFAYLKLSGGEVLYAQKNATDQLRKIHGVSITKLEREQIGQLYVVTAYATDKDGRTDSSIGAVSIEGLKGESLSNAMMKAETKSKRRVTLSLCGLGMLDESEVDSIPGAERVEMVLPNHDRSSAREPSPERSATMAELTTPPSSPVTQIGPTPDTQEALKRNANLLQVASESGVKGLRQLTAQVGWPLERIEEVNTELGERIKSRDADLDEQFSEQEPLPA